MWAYTRTFYVPAQFAGAIICECNEQRPLRDGLGSARGITLALFRYAEYLTDGVVEPFRLRITGNVWCWQWFHLPTILTILRFVLKAAQCLGLGFRCFLLAEQGLGAPGVCVSNQLLLAVLIWLAVRIVGKGRSGSTAQRITPTVG